MSFVLTSDAFVNVFFFRTFLRLMGLSAFAAADILTFGVSTFRMFADIADFMLLVSWCCDFIFFLEDGNRSFRYDGIRMFGIVIAEFDASWCGERDCMDRSGSRTKSK